MDEPVKKLYDLAERLEDDPLRRFAEALVAEHRSLRHRIANEHQVDAGLIAVVSQHTDILVRLQRVVEGDGNGNPGLRIEMHRAKDAIAECRAELAEQKAEQREAKLNQYQAAGLWTAVGGVFVSGIISSIGTYIAYLALHAAK